MVWKHWNQWPYIEIMVCYLSTLVHSIHASILFPQMKKPTVRLWHDLKTYKCPWFPKCQSFETIYYVINMEFGFQQFIKISACILRLVSLVCDRNSFVNVFIWTSTKFIGRYVLQQQESSGPVYTLMSMRAHEKSFGWSGLVIASTNMNCQGLIKFQVVFGISIVAWNPNASITAWCNKGNCGYIKRCDVQSQKIHILNRQAFQS